MGSKDVILQLTVLILFTLQVWADQLPVNHPVRDVLGKMDELREEIASLTKRVVYLDDHIKTVISPEDCIVGINSPYCSLAIVDHLLNERNILSSHNMPGKRTKRQTKELDRVNRVIEDLSRKQVFLRSLKKMLNEADSIISNESKRSCDVNLGFHCQTDQYIKFADYYDFLRSGNSPGKRRRRSAVNAHKQH